MAAAEDLIDLTDDKLPTLPAVCGKVAKSAPATSAPPKSAPPKSAPPIREVLDLTSWDDEDDVAAKPASLASASRAQATGRSASKHGTQFALRSTQQHLSSGSVHGRAPTTGGSALGTQPGKGSAANPSQQPAAALAAKRPHQKSSTGITAESGQKSKAAESPARAAELSAASANAVSSPPQSAAGVPRKYTSKAQQPATLEAGACESDAKHNASCSQQESPNTAAIGRQPAASKNAGDAQRQTQPLKNVVERQQAGKAFAEPVQPGNLSAKVLSPVSPFAQPIKQLASWQPSSPSLHTVAQELIGKQQARQGLTHSKALSGTSLLTSLL